CDVIKEKVRHIVSQRTTDEEFHRKVVNALGILALIRLLGPNPSLRKDITHRAGDSLETLASADRGCFLYKLVQLGRICPRRSDYCADLVHDVILPVRWRRRSRRFFAA